MNPIRTGAAPAGKFITVYTSSVFIIPSVNSANTAIYFPRLVNADTVHKCDVIHTFGSEPYLAVSPIPITIEREGDSFTASFVDANINSSGETAQQAIALLKDLILLRYERLRETDDSKLGHHLLKQKHVLMASVKAL